MLAALEFSIVLPTRNRARLLDSALAALLGIDYPADRVELIVVDNGSTDDTRAIVKRHAGRCRFDFRYVLEPRPGASSARNRGIAEARGTYLVFTDDDQKVDPAILRDYARIVGEHGAQAIQGAIELEFGARRPPWLHGDLAGFLGETPHTAEGASGRALYSGNMLLHRELIERVGGFREDLGKGVDWGYSEDVELSQRVLASGVPIYRTTRARQWHVIGPERTTPRYFRRTAFAKGVSQGSITESRLLHETGSAAATAARQIVGAAVARLQSDEHQRLLSEVRALYALGRLLGYARVMRGAHRRASPARASAI